MSNFDAGYDADGNAKTYTTRTLALAACADDNSDNIRVYYSDANANPVWFEAEISTTKHVGWEGMLGYQQCIQVVSDSASDIWCAYDQAANQRTGTVTVQNFTFLAGYADAVYAVKIDNDNAATTAELFVERCRTYGCGLLSATDYSFNRVRYCLMVGALQGIVHVSANKEMLIANCTAIACGYGFQTTGGGTKNEIYNSVAFGCANADFTANWDATSDYNVSGDASAPDNGNSITNETWGDLKFSDPELNNDSYQMGLDYRPTTGSSLIDAGTTVANLTDSTDIDGQSISTQPIGCSIGVTEFPTSSGGGGTTLGAFENGAWR